jgi:hypothetical protein
MIVIAGCNGLVTTSQPVQKPNASQVPEFLYVGTSAPGLLKYEVATDGSLKLSPTSGSAPPVCSPVLSPVPDHIYSLSPFCPFSTSQTELRRFDLNRNGDIVASTGPLSLGPDLPSNTGFPLSFLAAPDGRFAYVGTIAVGGSFHISPVQISSGGNLTAKPELGIAFIDPVVSDCSHFHTLDAVIETADGPLLSVLSSEFCKGADGPDIIYSFYRLDSNTGAIGAFMGGAGVDPATEGFFIAYNGTFVMAGGMHLSLEPSRVQLFRIDPNGLTPVQVCLPDHPACAHTDAGAIHPSAKWAFIADFTAGGLWTLPISGNSIAADKASFISANVIGGLRFAFSANRKYMYVAHWGGARNAGEILGFNVDQETGVLTPISGSPWPVGSIVSVTSLIDVAGKAQ